jgi:CHAT domain-containing protein
LNAGVSQAAMSLWSVDDQATTVLMLAFISHLRELPAPDALRRAMIELRDGGDQPTSPALWASFMIIGVTW